MIISQSPWAYPTTITQIAESDAHVAWDSSGFSYVRFDDGSFLRTVKTLTHIPNSFAGDRTMKTYYLLCSGFNFEAVPNKITGILIDLKTNRGGRITDDTVQLRTVSTWTGYTGAVGDNRATGGINPQKYYGGSIDLWGWDKIGYVGSFQDYVIRQAVINPDFGIAIRFQSHPYWPHNSTPMIDYVRILLVEDDGTIPPTGIQVKSNGYGGPSFSADSEGGLKKRNNGAGDGAGGGGGGGQDGGDSFGNPTSGTPGKEIGSSRGPLTDIPNPGEGNNPNQPFIGSYGYYGSNNYTGSTGYISSFGYLGSAGDYGYLSSVGGYAGSAGNSGYVPPAPV